MAYTLYQSGVTGPAANIGSGDDYHIDSKFSTSIGEEKARRMFEEKVKKYNSLGRKVEFSNQGASGLIYDMSKSDEERAAIFRQAYGAHAPREGWYSLDYYAPKVGEDRWGKSAEGAPIFAVGLEGGERITDTGGGYGYHSLLKDTQGNIIAKVGHGDDRFPNSDNSGIKTGAGEDPSTPAPDADKAVSPASTPKSPAEVNAEYDKMRMAGDVFKAEEFGMEQHKRLFNKK